MRLGIISDIHADLTAFNNAIELLSQHEVDKIICAGDIVEKGLEGDEVAEIMQINQIPSVRGNHDESAIRYSQSEVITRKKPLKTETIEYLKTLPPYRRYVFENHKIFIGHCSIPDYNVLFTVRHSAKKYKRMMKKSLQKKKHPYQFFADNQPIEEHLIRLMGGGNGYIVLLWALPEVKKFEIKAGDLVLDLCN